jgi:cell wall-associated NlpC family hydrolase
VSSHRLKRAVRGALSVTAVISVIGMSQSPAYAQPAQPPPPTTVSEAIKQFQELSKQAETVSEELNHAKEDLKVKQADLDKAIADVAASAELEKQAAAQEEQFRGQVDQLTSASFQGARFNKISALLTGSSADDFLERASALTVLASDNQNALEKYTGAVDLAAQARKQAEDGRNRAAEAKAASEKLLADITKKKTDLDAQIKQVEEAKNRLSPKDKDDLFNPPIDTGVYVGSGDAGKAMEVALAQRGDPYVWGAEGPNAFDCSGLTLYAYRAIGINLPHSSRSQFTYGKSVSKSELAPGDLLFYGGSASTIHHVAMYIGNGMLVHASTSGVPVKTAPLSGGGSDYLGAKRIVG